MDTIQVLLLVIIIVIIGVIVYIKFTDSGKALAKKYLPSFIAGFESEQFSADEEAMKKEKNLISMISRSDLIPGEIKTQVIDRITNGQVSELQIIEMFLLKLLKIVL